MTAEGILGGLLIFGFRVTDVSMDMVRLLLTVRGRKFVAGMIGFFEVLIFLTAISRVVTAMDNYWNVLGYCLGFATGTVVGAMIEETLAIGYSLVRVVSSHQGAAIAQALRAEGFGATKVAGEGQEGEVGIVLSVVRRRDVPTAMRLIEALDPEAFVGVEDERTVYRGQFIRQTRR
ncbi:MAG: DUF2179 domain-containing protein [candidate division NC10 bacterium]|nr:DUF2179 domain-containing protein [candidate division NC10 bacterium]MBI3002819.1 DUF2179 domain-containing protein [candidate division NC10 bacterium]